MDIGTKLWENGHLRVGMGERTSESVGLSEECWGGEFLGFHAVVLSSTFFYWIY